jgi:hypothetical protein
VNALDTFALILIGAVAATVLVGAIFWRWRGSNASSNRGSASIERDFRNVFAMMSKERQEAMITGLMDRRKCTRDQAMRLAVQERRHHR